MDPIFLITGPPGIGKSTILAKVVLRVMSYGVIVGGCTTAEIRRGGARVGFEVRDVTNGTRGELATTSRTLGPKVGKYRVNLADLASVGAKGLSDAVGRSELIVVDEIGPMELVSPEFRKAIRACIESGKPMLAVVHERMEDDLLSELRAKAGEVIEVDENNREQLVDEIADDLLAATRASKSG